jgi:ribonuclease P protein component
VIDERLPRAQRISKRSDFEHAYNTGSRRRGALMTLFVVRTTNVHARIGVAATRKLGSAVTRNRAKRLAREMLRRHKAVPGTDVVLVPRREMLDADITRIEADYLALLGSDRAGGAVATAGRPRGPRGPADRPRGQPPARRDRRL